MAFNLNGIFLESSTAWGANGEQSISDTSLRSAFQDENVPEEQETNEWAIELMPDVNPQVVAEKHGFEYVGPAFGHDGIHLFRQKENTVHGETHPHPLESRSLEIAWGEKQIARKRAKRSYSDPIYPNQWHLHGSSLHNIHVNVTGVWESGLTGQGVVIAIVDDGMEYTHPDLAPNYVEELSWDFNYDDPNPFPDSSRDDHGTSAAGVAAARDNTACGLGSAYRAGLAAIRLISKSVTDVLEGAGLKYRNDKIDIYSNSWGPVDDGKRKEGPGTLALAALKESIENGRGGKGVLYVWAGGNGRRSGDNCNYDGWANHRWTITIGAVDYTGKQPWYSESCAMLLAAAPSSGSGQAISTSDLMGLRGSTSTDCTSSFGGTSAAAPLAAGVVALVLEANPLLTWRDMQAVLLLSASPVDESDSDWKLNGGHLWFNHKYGYGLLNAGRAVELAKTWTLLPTQQSANVTFSDLEEEIGSHWTSINFTIGDSFNVEHVELYFSASHPKRGEVEVILVSPLGMRSVLAERHGDRNRDYRQWRFGSIAHWGEESQGVWQLRVRDTTSKGGYVTEAELVLYGHKP